MALYLLNKEETLQEGKELALQAIGELMECERKSPEQWFNYYVESAKHLGLKEFDEYIEMVVEDLVDTVVEVEGTKDEEGILHKVFKSVFINYAMLAI